MTILRWEKDECNACFASISFRYWPEEDYRQERWETHVFSKAKRDYRVYRKFLLGYIIFKIHWKCVNGIDKYYSESFQTWYGVILFNFPLFLWMLNTNSRSLILNICLIVLLEDINKSLIASNAFNIVNNSLNVDWYNFVSFYQCGTQIFLLSYFVLLSFIDLLVHQGPVLFFNHQ